MFSKATFIATLFAACTVVSASPGVIWDPKITSPLAGTVWPAGSVQTVTWDTSDAPSSISEASAIDLVKGGVQDDAHPLASGFDLRSGSQQITVPATAAPGDDYQIVLFGDSGNLSGVFTIV